MNKKEVTYRDLSKWQRALLVFLSGAGSGMIYVPVYLKNVFYTPLLEGLNITNAQLGFLSGMYGIMATLLYIPCGIVADKVRIRTLCWVGFVTTAILVFWYSTLPSYPVLVLIFALMAVTTILIWWGCRYKLLRFAAEEEKYSTLVGTSYGLYGLGGMFLNGVGLVILNQFPDGAVGIKYTLAFFAVVILILGIIAYFGVPRFEGEIDKSKKFNLDEFKQALKHPGVWFASLILFFVMFVYMGMNYTTPYLTDVFAASLTLTGIVGIIRYYGIALISAPLMGRVAEKNGSPSKTILMTMIIAAILCASLIVLPRTSGFLVPAVIIILALGFIANGGYGIASSVLTEGHVPAHIFGSATGILSVVGFLPESFMHQVFGSLIDNYGNTGYNYIFGILTACAIIAVVLCYVALKYFNKQKQEDTENIE